LSARYEEIAAYIRRLVATGQPGDRLPSEAELCDRFGVSRMTARQGLQQLAADGLVRRQPGQGTFIAARPVTRALGSPLSFTENMRQRGLRATSQLLTAALVEPTPEDNAVLRLDGDGRRVVLVERLRLADDVPLAIERAVLIPELTGVLQADLEQGSMHSAMEQLGRVPTRSSARVSARRSTTRERRLLQQRSSGVVLCETHVIIDQDGVLMEHTDTYYAAERYVFDAVVERVPATPHRSLPQAVTLAML
jgi:GntR family transcriptional regulator